MNEELFVTASVLPGKTNALVKNIMKQTGTDDPNEAVRLVNSGEWVVVKAVIRLLRKIASVSVKGAKKFVAKGALKTANVGWTNDNFKALFLDKVEENVDDAVIAIHNLERASVDAPIQTELGTRVETKLAHFFGLLEKQSKGEAGPLLINGYANIAYIIGNDGNFWAVDAYWDSSSGDWDVYAHSVGNPYEWNAGNQVLSRDS